MLFSSAKVLSRSSGCTNWIKGRESSYSMEYPSVVSHAGLTCLKYPSAPTMQQRFRDRSTNSRRAASVSGLDPGGVATVRLGHKHLQLGLPDSGIKSRFKQRHSCTIPV